MKKKGLCIVWLDAHSEDNWIDLKDIKISSAPIVSYGHFIGETSKMLCIAQSNNDGMMYCGLLHIPKCSIVSCENIKIKKKKRKKK